MLVDCKAAKDLYLLEDFVSSWRIWFRILKISAVNLEDQPEIFPLTAMGQEKEKFDLTFLGIRFPSQSFVILHPYKEGE